MYHFTLALKKIFKTFLLEKIRLIFIYQAVSVLIFILLILSLFECPVNG